MTDPARLAHVLRVQAPGGAEAEVSLALGATTAEAVGALCTAMGLEDHTQDLALFLREASGPRILQASERPLELCLRRADLPDGRAPFLLRRLPRASAGQRAPEGSPYALLAVAQGVEDYMRTPVPPPEDGAAEFASLRLLLDGGPLTPGVVARSIGRYVHPGVRDRRTPKDWDVLVLSRARGHPRAQARRLLLEFVDGAELLEMAFFEAAHPSAGGLPVLLAVDPGALRVFDRETHRELARHPLPSVHSWTADAGRGRLDLLVAWQGDRRLLSFATGQALAVVSLIRYHVARALEQAL